MGRTCGGGAGPCDLRGEADGAVAALAPEADVVELAGEVGLAGGDGRGGRQVVVEGGDGADLRDGGFMVEREGPGRCGTGGSPAPGPSGSRTRTGSPSSATTWRGIGCVLTSYFSFSGFTHQVQIPGGGGGAGVDVDVDDVAGVGGGNEHVLARVRPADY